MRFSVITVAFNNLSGLRATMESIDWRRCDLFQWIVVDGGSSDGSPEFLSRLAKLNFSFVSEPDRGIYDAMNKGIRMGVGQYCIFMNAGDCFAEGDVLARVDEMLGDRSPHIVYGDAIERDGDERWFKAARNPEKNFYSMFTHHQSIFYRSDLLRGGYDLTYRFSADWAMTAHILATPGCDWLRFPGPVCLFERGGVSQSDDYRALIDREHWRICREESRLNPLSALLVWRVKRGFNALRRRFPHFYDQLRFKALR